jgi:hypothetical protein
LARKNGRYREPVAQFYLENAGQLAGENPGEGLIQLWVVPGFDDYLIRVVPNSAIKIDSLSACPDEINEEYFEDGVFYDPFEAWPGNNCKVYQISGISDQVLNWDSLINFAADDYSFDEKFGKGLAGLYSDNSPELAKYRAAFFRKFFFNTL